MVEVFWKAFERSFNEWEFSTEFRDVSIHLWASGKMGDIVTEVDNAMKRYWPGIKEARIYIEFWQNTHNFDFPLVNKDET